jgi:preprotein translocase subunit SecY
MPYTASIVVQLMGIAIPYAKNFKVMVKRLIRLHWLTIVITLVQGPTYIYNLYRTLPSSAFY